MRTRILPILAAAVVACGAGAASAAAQAPPYKDPSLPVSQRVADLLSRMTLEEKVGQMTQTERYQVFDDETPITTCESRQHPLWRRLGSHAEHR